VKGRYRKRGREQRFAERYTSIWVSEDNRWRVRHEHSSSINSAH
jgi:ketosteroid isomerase-like protein